MFAKLTKRFGKKKVITAVVVGLITILGGLFGFSGEVIDVLQDAGKDVVEEVVE